MPQIGWLEILIIVSIAIIVIGPKDFPIMIKKLGTWVGSIKRYVSNIQNQVSDISNIDIEKDNIKDNDSDLSKEKDKNV